MKSCMESFQPILCSKDIKFTSFAREFNQFGVADFLKTLESTKYFPQSVCFDLNDISTTIHSEL